MQLHRSTLGRIGCKHPVRGPARAAALPATAGAPAKAAKQHGDATPGLRLFLDTADVKVWRQYASTGTLWGVTTNPAILEKDKVPCTLAAAAGLAKEVGRRSGWFVCTSLLLALPKAFA
jgi:hypothetical protein